MRKIGIHFIIYLYIVAGFVCVPLFVLLDSNNFYKA